MVRIISTFLILSLIVIHGQIDHAMFGSHKTTAQISEITSSGIQNSADIYASSELDECCADKNSNVPIKVSYCHLDSGMSQSGAELNFPSSKQQNLPGSSLALIAKEPAFPLRPPIA
jgi:hypothetical protein